MLFPTFVCWILFTGIVCEDLKRGETRAKAETEDESSRLVTSNPDEFELFLRGLAEKQGKECETKTLSAVLKALATGKPRSYVFIFTNGPAKDYYLVSKVLQKVAEKRSQVVFVLGELCAAPGHVGYKVYERIALHSSGQVLHVNGKDINLALRFVNTAIQINKVQLLSINAKGPSVRTFSFLVDSHLNNIVMSTVGKRDVQVEVKYPDELKASRVEKVIKSRKVVVTKIEKPVEGIWSISVKSAGNYSIKVTSESPFFIDYGFSTKKYSSKGADFKLQPQPVLDATNYLYVTFKSKTKTGHIGILKQVDILQLNGKTIKTIRTSPGSLLEDSFIIKLIPPRDPFLLRFIGVDNRGDFARVSPNVVDPVLPDLPRLTMKPRYQAFTGQELLSLFCYVDSIVPFTVTWSSGDIPLDKPTKYIKSVNSSLWIPLNAFSSYDNFTCTARNIAGVTSKTTVVSIVVAPPIIEDTGNKTALLGENVFLQCPAFSTEPIKITWFRNDKQITSNGRFVITTDLQVAISNTLVADSGWYFCSAENSGGKSVTSFYFQVYEDPVISVFPQIEVFKAGDSFSFVCDVVGQFSPKITWLKDDKKISKDTRIQTGLQNELFITEAKVEDDGKYTCVANYSQLRPGVVLRSSAFAEFRTPPNAKISSEQVSVLAGNPVTLKCIATGKPEPDITWHRNGEPVIFDKRIVMSDRSLFILEARLEDTGSYSCIAQNSEGLDFASVHMLVGTKPKIIEEKVRKVEVEKGRNVTLECSAEGAPAPFVYWIGTNGKEIEKSNGVVRLPSGKLLIKSMSRKHTGKYLCKAENQFGSEMAQIDVEIIGLEKPKIASLENMLIYANKGDEIILPCDVSGRPKPKFKWVRRGGNFDLQSDRFKVLANGGLLIKNVTVDDSATYVCKATNNIGSSRADRKLLVTIPPVWTLKPGEVYDLFEGEELRLECFASGIPRPKITWRHNGKLLPIKEDVLIIKEVNKTNNGTYKCSAKNKGGRISSQTKVFVKDFNIIDVSSFELPGNLAVAQPLEKRQIDVLQFVVLPEDVRIRQGVSYVFNCLARGTPPPVVTWQRSGVEIDAPLNILPNNSLVINSARIEDSGFYACVAENDRGKIMKDFTVMVVVDGGFSGWSDWGPCSKSCGEGIQLRQRYCSNPTPRNGGRRCEGLYVQQRACNQNPCVSLPDTAAWSAWGECSKSCEGGRQYRFRTCRSGSADCATGMQIEHRICNRFKCGGILGITEVIGSISGTINRKDIGSVALMAQISYVDQFVVIKLDVKNIPKPLLYIMRSVVSFLVPVYWSVVNQGEDGFNGISIALGKFTYNGKIKYNDVQILSTTCVVSAIPGSKSLMMETTVTGDVQHFPRNGFTPQNYNELFLQTSSMSVHGNSERYILIGKSSTKYYLEHSIIYASDRTLDFPAQIYNVQPEKMEVNEEDMSIRHIIKASYVEGKNECPAGFQKEDRFCFDVNECQDSTRCEQLCINTNGSFHCSCNKGFFLSRDGVSCQDINECRQSFHNCQDYEVCINTRGGYQCKEKDCLAGYEKDPISRRCKDVDECLKKDACPDDQSCINTEGSFECMWNPCPDLGFARATNGTCLDVDECSDNADICKEHEACQNTYGSYVCVGETCTAGFRRNAKTLKCEDVNECLRDVCKPTEMCLNTEGSYECFGQVCDVGFENVNGRCVDIDECLKKDSCNVDQKCINSEGSFLCLDVMCDSGYKRVDGKCQDIDECANTPSPCPDGSLCLNLIPLFTCMPTPCKRGYKYDSDKRVCYDIDECKEGSSNCHQFETCQNTIGSFFCARRSCPSGFKIEKESGNCIDIDECSQKIDNCRQDETCINEIGTFACKTLSTVAPTQILTTKKPMDSSVPIVTGANASISISKQGVTNVPAETVEPIIIYSRGVTDAPVTTNKPVITESTSPTSVKGWTGFLSATSKIVATKESVSPNKNEVELPKVETELPTEPGLGLPIDVIKNLVNGGNSEKESTTASPTLEEDKSSTHALPKVTKNDSGKNDKSILTKVPSEGNVTNSVGIKKTLIPFEPETENINGEQIADGSKKTVQKPDKMNVEPSNLPSQSSKPRTTVPNAVPLLTDDSGFDNFWWFFNTLRTPTKRPTYKRRTTRMPEIVVSTDNSRKEVFLTGSKELVGKSPSSLLNTQPSATQRISQSLSYQSNTEGKIGSLKNGINEVVYASAAAKTELPTTVIGTFTSGARNSEKQLASTNQRVLPSKASKISSDPLPIAKVKSIPKALTVTDKPVFTNPSTTKDSSVVRNALTTTEPPVTTDAPTSTESLIVTDAPTTTESPGTTDAPTTTELPIITDAPTTTEPPIITDAPTTTEPLTTTDAPTTTEPPSTTDAPTTTEPPSTTDAPTTTEPPSTTDAPTTTEPPSTTDAPTTTEPPSTTDATTTTEPPSTTDATTTIKPLVITDIPPTTEPSILTDAPTTIEPLVTTDAPTTTEPPVITDAPTTTEPPSTTDAPTTTEPSIATDPPTTIKPLVITDIPPTTEPSILTDAPTTIEPLVTTDAPTTTKPPVVTRKQVVIYGNRVSCRIGYRGNEKGICEDVDECKENSHSCQEDQVCLNFKGGHRCACKRGFRMRDGDRKCVDINECRMSLRLCQQDCINVIGSYRCKCRRGYTLKADQRSCHADVQTSKKSMMGRRATVLYAKPIRCFNFMDSTMCFCPNTYKWNRHGMRCEKTVVAENSIKENTLSTNPSRCFMFRGTKMCKCPSDYRWDMKQQLCKLSLNDFSENQVGLKEGGINVRETDLIDSTRKESKQKPTATVAATPIPTTAARTVATEKPCPTYFAQTCSYKCVTMNSMYLCICPAGYVNKYYGYCRDVNECLSDQNGCTKEQSCFNTLGSYRCVNFNCPKGFLHYGRRVCRKPCTRRPTGPNDICTDKYVAFRQFAAPLGTRANSYLATLRSPSHYSFLGRSQFYFKDGQSYFKLRKVGSACSLYTRRNLISPGDYSVEVIGDVIGTREQLLCRTTFKILVNVGEYPF